ncbi:MAG: circularly permuted type 2 ATP-grasp protein [Acidobacteria bacterium]|nr:circularly permuted type 2 ATP-grasp protein [Acidobacteriota bacterium]MDW7984426.1 circularly permuted type 2 ATP-grasp protein [Acidobacteriota bacterium]
MSLSEAIRIYHGLLERDTLAHDSQDQLDQQLRRKGLFFGPRPLCMVLRPRFLTPAQYRYLQSRVRILLRAFDKVYRRALHDPQFRSQFGLTPEDEALIPIDPGFEPVAPLSRLDGFLSPATGELYFTEYNAETPAGPAYQDALTEVFLGLPVMREFLRFYQVQPMLACHHTLHALLHAYRQWSGRRDRPNVAILDWQEVPTYSEFVLFANYLISQGIPCRIVDPRDVEYRNDRLMAGDFKIDLIYKRVLINELLRQGGLDHPVIQAVRDRNVCMVNPFPCKILHKKASLAVLSDERNADLFTAAERRAIDRHIPWTRLVQERYTTFQGRRVDLIPFILKDRAQWVLKPNDEYGGKGVVLGWLTSATEWEAKVRQALQEPFVVQRRVPIPSEPYPSIVDGQVQLIDRFQDTDPFVFYGAYGESCLTRLSTEALLNVTAGGGSEPPTVLFQKR